LNETIMKSHDVIECCEQIADIDASVLWAARRATWHASGCLRACAEGMLEELWLLFGVLPPSANIGFKKLRALRRIFANDSQRQEYSPAWPRCFASVLPPGLVPAGSLRERAR
jgi:hypothetical protein